MQSAGTVTVLLSPQQYRPLPATIPSCLRQSAQADEGGSGPRPAGKRHRRPAGPAPARPVHGVAPGLRYLAATGQGSEQLPADPTATGDRIQTGHCTVLSGSGRASWPAAAGAARLGGVGAAGLGALGTGTQPRTSPRPVPPAAGGLAVAGPGTVSAGAGLPRGAGAVLCTASDAS